MKFQGGKARLASHLAPHILAPGRTRYIEPFVGAGAVLTKVAPHFKNVQALDISPDLIKMWKALQQGWLPRFQDSGLPIERDL